MTFLGTGTSGGVPELLCGCAVCTSGDKRNRRLRSSAHLEIENEGTVTHLQLDTGPDFREQVLKNKIKKIDAILYTHSHFDHVVGLDDIRRFNAAQRMSIPVYGRDSVIGELIKKFDHCFNPVQLGGGVPLITPHIVESSFQVGNITVEPLEVMHGNLPIYGYRIGPLAYITDASFINDEVLAKLSGLDLLVLNALRFRLHPTHFNIEQAMAIVDRVKPRKAFFTHFTHDVEHKKVSRSLPQYVRLGYDGLVIRIRDD
jgi:phosphoribosyl 1,2-cyclic phosphate phosphodiesterase